MNEEKITGSKGSKKLGKVTCQKKPNQKLVITSAKNTQK